MSLQLLLASGLPAADSSNSSDEPRLRPCTGPTRTNIDATTLDGKVLCGYEGWFNTPGDGNPFGFSHWGDGFNREGGGRFVVDMWPDISEYNPRRTKPGTTLIARRKGEFYWRQFAIFKGLGIRTVFVGMLDEVNEGTAIYKVANDIPAGKYFVTCEGLPSDWYLKLTGAATRMIRGEVPLSEKIPEQLPFPKK